MQDSIITAINMKIAVLSGKGGTGKTLLSVNLAASLKNSIYVDCDVEEPNGHLFFKPKELENKEVSISIPQVDLFQCKGCRTCVDFCRFNALAYIKNKLYILEELCHSCGGCILFCPEKALLEKSKTIGNIQIGQSESNKVLTGILNTGEVSGVPIVKELLHQCKNSDELIFIDCPPGSACLVMESIKDADYCILTAEPTLFGVHNLSMVYELVKLLEKPHGVVLNKCLEGINPTEDFCRINKINILGKIPFDKDLGQLNSNALIAVRENRTYAALFDKLLGRILKEASYETTINFKR